MQNLQQDLINLLIDEENLIIDNQLNKNKIIEAALKVEPFLINLLIKNETFKKHFFQKLKCFRNSVLRRRHFSIFHVLKTLILLFFKVIETLIQHGYKGKGD